MAVQEQNVDMTVIGKELSGQIDALLPQNIRAMGSNEVVGTQNGFDIRIGRDFEDIGMGESEPYDYMVVTRGNTPIVTISDESVVAPLSDNRREVQDALRAARQFSLGNAPEPTKAVEVASLNETEALPATANFLRAEVENAVVFSKINFPPFAIEKIGEADGFVVYASQDRLDLSMGEYEMSNVLTVERNGEIVMSITDERNWDTFMPKEIVDAAVEATFKVISEPQ